MKKSNIKKDFQSIDDKLYEQFLDNTESDLVLENNLQGIEFDDSWIDRIYESIEFLDTIVRNPRRFIMQEEEIVPVEKAKKITLESIRHLAQNTHLIQDIDDDGSITPSSVLNVYKEESTDIYENRFFATLLNKLYEFIQQRKKIMGEGSFSNAKKNVVYEGKSNFSNNEVKMKLEFESATMKESDSKEEAAKKLEHIEMIVSDFLGSAFMKEMRNILPVRSPIRKTNIILKDQNFKSAVDLWYFIESYNVLDKKVLDNYKKYKNPASLQEKMDEAFLLNYFVIQQTDKIPLNPKITNYYIRRMIKNFMANNKVTPKEFRKMVSTELKEYQKTEAKKLRVAKTKTKMLFRKYETANQKLLEILE